MTTAGRNQDTSVPHKHGGGPHSRPTNRGWSFRQSSVFVQFGIPVLFLGTLIFYFYSPSIPGGVLNLSLNRTDVVAPPSRRRSPGVDFGGELSELDEHSEASVDNAEYSSGRKGSWVEQGAGWARWAFGSATRYFVQFGATEPPAGTVSSASSSSSRPAVAGIHERDSDADAQPEELSDSDRFIKGEPVRRDERIDGLEDPSDDDGVGDERNWEFDASTSRRGDQSMFSSWWYWASSALFSTKTESGSTQSSRSPRNGRRSKRGSVDRVGEEGLGIFSEEPGDFYDTSSKKGLLRGEPRDSSAVDSSKAGVSTGQAAVLGSRVSNLDVNLEIARIARILNSTKQSLIEYPDTIMRSRDLREKVFGIDEQLEMALGVERTWFLLRRLDQQRPIPELQYRSPREIRKLLIDKIGGLHILNRVMDAVNTSSAASMSVEDYLHWRSEFRRSYSYFCNGKPGENRCGPPVNLNGWATLFGYLGYEMTTDVHNDTMRWLIMYGYAEDECEMAFPGFRAGVHLRWCLGRLWEPNFASKGGLGQELESLDRANIFSCINSREFYPRSYPFYTEEHIDNFTALVLSEPVQFSNRWFLWKRNYDTSARGILIVSNITTVVQSWDATKRAELAANKGGATVTTGPRKRRDDTDVSLRPDVTETPDWFVMQEYIRDPLLWDGRKFSIRVWAYVVSVSPLVVLSHDGIVYRCIDPYTPDSFDPLTHFTNNQDLHHDFAKLFFDGKIGNGTVLGWMEEDFVPWAVASNLVAPDYMNKTFRPITKKIMAYSIYSLIRKEALRTRSSIGQMQHFCFDFMLDSRLRIWLLEVNRQCVLDVLGKFYSPPQQVRLRDALGLTSIQLAEEVFYRQLNGVEVSTSRLLTSLGTWNVVVDETVPRHQLCGRTPPTADELPDTASFRKPKKPKSKPSMGVAGESL